ncbi:hypothetical protein LX32DRAFT_371871 [Colletotrichum zoysiae]|uniref:Uncharacterized protein n=1 Tax=Colletotrichum zoysiae TaxID=1216348 RepID=A0AAD9HUB2_9PEZI|nr:hypothetical protein LX32DRAFT_371871 [Colletotrichum zoysiae]
MGANPRHPYTLPAAALGRQGCVSARPQRLTLAPSTAHLCLFLHTWLSAASFLSPPLRLCMYVSSSRWGPVPSPEAFCSWRAQSTALAHSILAGLPVYLLHLYTPSIATLAGL